MKLNWLLLLPVPVILLAQGGGRILLESALLLAGTAIPLQLLIYAVWKLESMRSARSVIVRVFGSIPASSGLFLLVVLGAGLIFTVVFSVRAFVAPSDSWVLITLGFLWGIMSPILSHSTNQGRQREVATPDA